jgi:hypothetical protein
VAHVDGIIFGGDGQSGVTPPSILALTTHELPDLVSRGGVFP